MSEHADTKPEPPRWKSGIVVALGAMTLAAAIVWIPWWPARVLLGIGILAFVLWMLRDPRLFFMNSSRFAIGAGIGIGSLPAFDAAFGLPDGTWGAVFIESSPWVAGALVIASMVFGALELFHRRPRSGPPTNQSPPVAGPGSTVITGSVGTLIQNPPATNVPAKPKTAPQNSSARSPGPTNLPPLSRTFVPRPEVTDQIHRALEGEDARTGVLRQAAARAHGGYGKTVSALLYAHEHAQTYPGGRFFLSMEKAELGAQLALLAGDLGLDANLKPEVLAPQVKAALEGPEPSLLILDNVEGNTQWQAMLGTGLVPIGECRVLITTRSMETIAKTEDVTVGRLSDPQARAILARFCGGSDDEPGRPRPPDDIADQINGWLGGLAVAIAAVGAFMRLNPKVEWAEHWDALQGLDVGDLPDVEEGVRRELGIGREALEEHRRTLEVIDNALDALDAPARRAVEYAAVLPADLAPRPWLVWMLNRDSDIELAKTATADPRSPAAYVLDRLERLDVLTPKDDDHRLLSLHRLWRARVNERGDDRDALWTTIEECVQSRRDELVGPDGIDHPAVLTDPTHRWELGPLASAIGVFWEAGRLQAGMKSGAWVAGLHRLLGLFSAAVTVLAPVRELTPDEEARVDPGLLAGCHSNLALILQDLGDHGAARERMERAIEIQEKHFDADHPTLATSFSNLATILRDLGDLGGARERIEHAINIDEKHFDEDHPTIAIRYSILSLILNDLGNLVGARERMERAIEINEKHFDADHPTLATSLSNLASILRALGDLVSARERMERAIEIQEKHFDTDHPALATSLSNLAPILRALGDLGGARERMERAIEIQEKHFDTDHPALANSFSNLALILQDLGDLGGARERMERAIEIKEKHFDADHPTLATSYSNLATILLNLGDLGAAREQIERAIAIEQKHFDADHPKLAISYNNLAHIDLADGNRDAACTNWRRALAILRKHFDESHPNIQSTLVSMAYAGCSNADS